MDRIKQADTGGTLDAGDKVAHSILQLPHHILRYHDVDELPQLVLHDLGHESNFGLNKAAYLVDNPEFNCVKGVAGFNRDECSFHRENVWEAPHEFGGDMRDAVFHNNMKNFVQDMSVRRRDLDVHNPDDLAVLGTTLGLKNPSFFTWNMRHGNHGILLFEEGREWCARHRDLLSYAAALLSLC
jgi:hypothetical protein